MQYDHDNIYIYQICLSTKFSQLKNRSVSTFLFSTTITIIFLPLLLDKKLVTIQLKVKELCYNYNNYIIYIYYKITKRCCFLLTYLSILLDWLANGYYILDHIYSREEKNELIPNCVFGACFAHKKYTKQKNIPINDIMCCASCQKKILGKNKINAFTYSHNTKKV